MTWIQILKLDNAQAARMILEGRPKDNPHENFNLCCEHAREHAERQLRDYGEIGRGVLQSSEWKNYNCTNLRRELEMFADMGMPGMQQIIDAWDKCSKMRNPDDLV